MSFSTELKEELSKIENLPNKDAVKFELIGYLISSNVSEFKNKIKYKTENEYNINRFSKLLSNLGIENFDISLKGKLFIITLNKKEIENIKFDFKELSQDEQKWLIRGAYMGAGSINNPEKKYHLELGIRKKEYADDVHAILEKLDVKSSMIIKRNEYAIYIKDGEEISKFLALISANRSVIKFEEIRVQRYMNNKINRIVNCETANMNKTINASIEQIEAIRKLKKSNKFKTLDEPLKEIAEIRLKNPNASLIEIGKMLKEPIGKSGVNYRLKKLVELGKEEETKCKIKK